MQKLKKRLVSKAGAVTIEYVLIIVLVVLGLVGALTVFTGSLGKTINSQGSGIEKTANDSYCKTQAGMTSWAGGYVNNIPTCK